MRSFDTRTTGTRERELLQRLREVQHTAGGLEACGWERLIPAFPLKIQLQTTTRCNAACTMCPYPAITAQPDFAHGQMDEALYRLLLRQMAGKGLERLSLFLMNEPLVDRRMVAWIAMARAALPDVVLNLFSNGSPLTASLALRLAEAGLDELCVSVHGFDRASYEEVMRGLSYERLTSQLREVLELEARGALGQLRIHLVCGDLPALRRSLNDVDPLLRDHLLFKAFSNEREITAVPMGLPSSSPLTMPGLPPLCQRPFVKLYVLADGTAVLCNCDWRRSVILGRVEDRPGASIEDIWLGARYRAIRAQHLRGELDPEILCARCDYPRVAGHV